MPTNPAETLAAAVARHQAVQDTLKAESARLAQARPVPLPSPAPPAPARS